MSVTILIHRLYFIGPLNEIMEGQNDILLRPLPAKTIKCKRQPNKFTQFFWLYPDGFLNLKYSTDYVYYYLKRNGFLENKFLISGLTLSSLKLQCCPAKFETK